MDRALIGSKGGPMQAGTFVEQALKILDADELFSLYCRSMNSYGINRIIYSALRNASGYETQTPGISHCYPSDWISHYAANNLAESDPVRATGLLTRHAFSWNDMIAKKTLSREQLLVMEQGREAGLKDGVGMAFHGPMGETFGVGLASSDGNPDIHNFLTNIEVLSTHFHITFSALYEREKPEPAKLTPRELEVLKWAAAGKSNWAIGEILSISEHGVDFHMRNILRKLDADTRVTAVVKALHNGILTL